MMLSRTTVSVIGLLALVGVLNIAVVSCLSRQVARKNQMECNEIVSTGCLAKRCLRVMRATRGTSRDAKSFIEYLVANDDQATRILALDLLELSVALSPTNQRWAVQLAERGKAESLPELRSLWTDCISKIKRTMPEARTRAPLSESAESKRK